MSDQSKTEQFVHDLTGNAWRLYAYILALVPNWADADELFQETSTTLWLKYDDYQPGTNFRAWAFRVAFNKVLQFRHAQGKNILRFSDEFVDAVDGDMLEADSLWERRHRLLADCYAKLSPKDRGLIDLRYEPDATTKCIAEKVGRSVDAVYKALNRIHEQLLDCIDRTMEDTP